MTTNTNLQHQAA